MMHGSTIVTRYGEGVLDTYRECDGVYTVTLPFGILFCGNDCFETKHTETEICNRSKNESSSNDSIMELNIAYEALESMRKLNTELTCQERGIPLYHLEECHCCLLSRQPETTTTTTKEYVSSPLSRIVHQTRKAMKAPSKSPPCLSCGQPVCRKHSSSAFRKEDITLCHNCESLFGLDFVVELLTSPDAASRRQCIDRLMELYDRAILMLKYSAQFVDDIANQLDANAAARNRVGLGSSTAGIVSGVLGIASAVTIFTPAGPPLLLASLLFGGSATAVQTGSEVHMQFSEPNKLADRLIALYSICWNILKVMSALRDAILRDHLRTDLYDTPQQVMLTEESGKDPHQLQQQQTNLVSGASTIATLSLSRAAFMGGMETGQVATSAAESAALASRNVRLVSRGSSVAMRTLSFARFAGGTLSAATLLFEARTMQQTLRSIHAGNPCHKAETLRRIQTEIVGFPSTHDVDSECNRYLDSLQHRQRSITEQECRRLLLENSEILQEAQEMTLLQQQRITESDSETIVMGDDSETSATSLRERIVRSKIRTNQYISSSTSPLDCDDVSESNESIKKPGSLLHRIELYKRRESSSLQSH